jgi:hypothetical protein
MRPSPLLHYPAGIGLLLATGVALATPVYVETTDSFGRGIAELRGAECMVVLPAHVAGESRQIDVYGRSGAFGRAGYVKDIGKKGDDLMLFRVLENSEAICDDTEAAMLKAMPGGVAFRREKNGALNFEQVSVTRDSQLNLTFVFLREGAREAPGISGSVIYVGGKPQGIIIAVGLKDGRPNIARQLEYVAAMEGSWVLGQASDVSTIQDSLAILQIATEMRSKGDMGQIAAAEGMVRSGSALSGIDLRGVGLAGAALNNGNLVQAQLQGAILENALLQSARISEARFDFANLEGVQAKSADATKARFYYANTDGGDFSGANATQSNWGGASAREVNFRGADLSGASFFLADLTGADFSNAILTQTSFIGAILTGANFTGAKFDRTDFTAASGDIHAFSEAQQVRMCATLLEDTIRTDLIRLVPSTRFSSGVDYDELIEHRIWLQVSVNMLPQCPKRDLLVAGLPSFSASEYDPSGTEKVTSDFRIDYESQPYDKIGLRREWARRVRDQIQRIETALNVGAFLRLEHARTKDLYSALEAKVTAVDFVGEFSLNYSPDAELVGFKYDPASPLVNEYWTTRAKVHLQTESSQRSAGSSNPVAGNWEKFYPEGTSMQELSEAHVDLFRQWTLNRAKAIPSTAFIQFNMPSGAISMVHNAQISLGMQPEKRLTIKPFIDLGNPAGKRRLPEGTFNLERLFSPAAISSNLILELDEPLETYVIDADTETLAFLRANPRLQLEMKLVGGKLIDDNPQRPGDHYILIRFSPIKLTALARDGTKLVLALKDNE